MADNYGVLFVDDEVNVLKSLQRSLRREPYKTFFATGPEKAFEILNKEDVHLVVSDNLMPEMDGLTFLGKVKQLYPGVIRIILTGHADLETALKAINQGEVYRFLTKPWIDVELKITIKHILDVVQLRSENQLLTSRLEKQQVMLDKLENEHPGIFKVKKNKQGAIVINIGDI